MHCSAAGSAAGSAGVGFVFRVPYFRPFLFYVLSTKHGINHQKGFLLFLIAQVTAQTGHEPENPNILYCIAPAGTPGRRVII